MRRRRLNLFAIGADINEHRIDTTLIDNTHTLAGDPQRNETLFSLDPKTVVVQIRQETALGAVLRVGYVVTDNWTLAGDLTDSGHGDVFQLYKSNLRF
jgi:hypothetical protein